MDVKIPKRIIFIWLGTDLPDSAILAIRSACAKSRPLECLLLHEGLNKEDPRLKKLVFQTGVVLETIESSLFIDLPGDQGRASHIFYGDYTPATRANILRMAILYKRGGIYLDTDTITVAGFDDLLGYEGFCGTEPVVYPYEVRANPTLVSLVSPWIKKQYRRLCVKLPSGYRLYRKSGFAYKEAVNNAVIGSAPGNPIWSEAFARINAMSEAEINVRFRMGTHLLQELSNNKPSQRMHVLPSKYFYPLGPEISAFWFKQKYSAHLIDMLYKETRVVHWYNSLEQSYIKEPLTFDWLRANPTTPLYALTRNYLND
jgi:hypothetical protein